MLTRTLPSSGRPAARARQPDQSLPHRVRAGLLRVTGAVRNAALMPFAGPRRMCVGGRRRSRDQVDVSAGNVMSATVRIPSILSHRCSSRAAPRYPLDRCCEADEPNFPGCGWRRPDTFRFDRARTLIRRPSAPPRFGAARHADLHEGIDGNQCRPLNDRGSRRRGDSGPAPTSKGAKKPDQPLTSMRLAAKLAETVCGEPSISSGSIS